MASVIKLYLVVSSLPVVVEDAGIAVSYQPGAIFEARNTNASVVRLLADEKIVETTGVPGQGSTVIQGQQGPIGPTGPTGPAGPPGGLPAALAIDNTTSGLDIEITDGDAIVGQTDGGWDLGSPDGGTTPLRPATVYVQTEVNLDDTTLTTTALTGAAALLITSGADTDLTLRGADATATSGNDGGAVVLQAGAKDGAGTEGKIEFRGNFPNALVADVDGALNLYDASSNKVIEVLADPGALRVGRNTQLTVGEGDFVFGNDGTLTGTPTGLLLWDATVQQLELRDNANNRTIEIDGSVPEIAFYENGGGDRAVYLAVTGSQLMLRAEHASMRPGTDAVFDILIKGGDASGTEDGSDITVDAGRALGTGTDGQLVFRTGNMDRWLIDPNGYLLAAVDNGYNIGAVGANRPLRVYVGTEVVVGSTITIGTDAITASGALNLSVDGDLTATAPASTTGAGGTWSWTLQTGLAGVAGVAPTAASAGGAWNLFGGVGGAAQGTGVGGETGGDAGPGGVVQVVGGTGGAGQAGAVDPGQPGPGGNLELFGGPGGAGAGTSDNADGSDVIIRGGVAGVGGAGPAAVNGDVVIGDTATTNVTCGSLSVTATQLVGSITTVNGGVSIAFETGGTGKWDIPTAGHFLAATDNVFDIGASGATRPRRVYVGTEVVVGDTITVGTDSITGSVDLALAAGGANDLTLAARGSTAIAFNEAGHLAFTGTVAGFSVVRAINTIEAAGGGGGSLAATLAIGNTTGANDIVISSGQKLTSPSNAGLTIRCTDPTIDDDGYDVTIQASDGIDVGGGLDQYGGNININAGAAVNQGGAGSILLTCQDAYEGAFINLDAGGGANGGDSGLDLSADAISLTPKISGTSSETIAIGGAATNSLGFYGGGGATQQTVTGSRGGNAALADLLTTLASLGLIVDGTSA